LAAPQRVSALRRVVPRRQAALIRSGCGGAERLPARHPASAQAEARGGHRVRVASGLRAAWVLRVGWVRIPVAWAPQAVSQAAWAPRAASLSERWEPWVAP